MPIAFNYASPVVNVAGFLDEPDPNATPPNDDRIFDIGKRREDGEPATGVQFYVKFDTPSAPTKIDVTVWILDRKNNQWAKAVFFNSVDGSDVALNIVEKVAPAQVFFQFTSLNAGTATLWQLFAEPI